MKAFTLLGRRIGIGALLLGLIFSGQGIAVAVPVTSAVPNTVGTDAVMKATAHSSVSLAVNQSVIRRGEQFWLAGKVKQGSRVSARRTVVIERRQSSASKWKRLTSVRTRSNGKFTATVLPTGVYEYRARVGSISGAGGAASRVKRVKSSSAKRNLASRTAAIGARLGKPSSGVRSLSASQRKGLRVKKLRTVQHRTFTKATLVKVVTSKRGRTWVVTGKIRAAYMAAGGPTGKYGVPIRDAECGLIEGGCVQRFSNGTLYSNDGKKRASGTSVRGRQGEMVSAARSQVGYKFKYVNSSRQQTKFNKFMGNERAWCSFLQSWASEASGNDALIPRSKSFTAFKKDVGRTMKTGKTPKVGALVFFNTYPPAGVVTHVGLVVGVSANNIRVIDGNTGGNLPAGHRGVLERNWPKSRALHYAYPAY